MSKFGTADSWLILANEQQLYTSIIFCIVLLKIIKLKKMANAFVILSTNRVICTYFREPVEDGVIPDQIVKDLARWFIIFIFENSEPVYETEYMYSLKQFSVQEVCP